jgi:hypothetical protein
LGATVNALTIGWELGIGLSAIIAAYLLIWERTKDWSEKKIIFISCCASFFITLCAIYILV